MVYIDPSFATGSDFIVAGEMATTVSAPGNSEIAYSDKLVGQEYLELLRARMILLRALLPERGSICVHTDYKVGHYVKVMMDEIFGIDNFRNDITRIKCNPKNFPRIGFGNIKDMILFYTKSTNPIWNEPYEPYTDADITRLFPKIDAQGRRYTTVPIHAPGETKKGRSNQPFKGMMSPKGRHWRTDVETLEQWEREGLIEWSSTGNPRRIIYADEKIERGKKVQDIWDFKDPQSPTYTPEKNLDLLNLIVRTSSNPGSIVLDCFCGSGTTLKAAHLNGRRWNGIDNSDLAIRATIARLEAIVPRPEYEFIDLGEMGSTTR